MKARSRTSSPRLPSRAGFTLVEMLVVTVILVILTSLISVAVFSALKKARSTRVALEASNLTQAFQAFESKYGLGFPPTDLRLANPPTESELLFLYVQRLFPRYDAATNLYSDLTTEGINVTDFDPGYSLVFWLVGFSGDPAAPFNGHAGRMGLGGTAPNQETTQYTFDTDRIRYGRYFPQVSGDADDLYTFTDTDSDNVWDAGEAFDGHNAFLYYDSGSYRGRPDSGAGATLPYQGFRPYRNGGTTDPHYNNESIQIVSAGEDKKLGDGTGIGPVLEWWTLSCGDNSKACEDDADNITNFSSNNTLRELVAP